jgi:O-antigen/teichoic acid export membrane protein
MATDQQPSALADLESDLLDTPAAGTAAIRGSALRSAGYILGVLLSLVSVPLLIRHLGSIEYGRYVVAITLVTIVQGITDVGLGQIGVREYSTRAGAEREWLMRNLLGVRIALTGVGVGLATGFALVAGYGHAVVLGTFLAGAAMVLTVIQGTFAVPLASRLPLGWVTALELLRQALAVAAIVALVLAGSGLLPFLAAFVPVALIVLLATALVIRGEVPLRPSFDREEWLTLMKAVLPFAAAVVIGTLYLRITVLLLSLMSSGLQTGFYATAFAVISVVIAIPALTVGSTLPVLSRAARDDRERLGYVLERLTEVTLIAGVGLALGLALGAGFVVKVLSGGSGVPVTVLQIESVAILTQFLAAPWQYGLLALHRHRSLLITSAAGLAASVILSLILIPPLQARGAAIAFSGAEMLVAGLCLVFLRNARPDLAFSFRVPARVLAGALLGVVVALLVPGLPSLPQAVIALVIYAAVLLLSGAIPRELKQALPGRAPAQP